MSFDPKARRLVVDRENDNPIFSILHYLISLTLDDDAFEAESAKNIQNVFR